MQLEDDGSRICDIVNSRIVPSWLEIYDETIDGQRRVGWRFEFAGKKYGNWIVPEKDEPPLGDDANSNSIRHILTINAWQSLGRILVKPKDEVKNPA